jgi:hypothetical protein
VPSLFLLQTLVACVSFHISAKSRKLKQSCCNQLCSNGHLLEKPLSHQMFCILRIFQVFCSEFLDTPSLAASAHLCGRGGYLRLCCRTQTLGEKRQFRQTTKVKLFFLFLHAYCRQHPFCLRVFGVPALGVLSPLSLDFPFDFLFPLLTFCGDSSMVFFWGGPDLLSSYDR